MIKQHCIMYVCYQYSIKKKKKRKKKKEKNYVITIVKIAYYELCNKK